MRTATTTALTVSCVATLFAACAEGGREDRLGSDVKITANHHLVGLIGSPAFGAFPVPDDRVAPSSSVLSLLGDSTYQIRSGSETTAGTYALEKDGELAVLLPTTRQTFVFRGAYGLQNGTHNVFFTDRVGTNIGLFLGVRTVQGTPLLANLAGDWHLLSMHVIFADQNALQSIHDVGRAFAGTVTVAADGSVQGRGSESTNSAARLPITGAAGAVKAFQDGKFELELDYGAETRTFEGGGSGRLIVAADIDERDGAAGLAAMVPEHAAPIDVDQLTGRYIAGIWTLFLKPNASGIDAGIGTLEFTADGNFRLAAVNNLGEDFGYSGSFEADDTRPGLLELDVSGTRETWFGAVDKGFDTIVLVDNFVERRANSQVELNFIVAIRPVPQ